MPRSPHLPQDRMEQPYIPDDESHQSILSAFIPPVVRNRVPRLPSFRKSVSNIRGRAMHMTTASGTGFSTPRTNCSSRDVSQSRGTVLAEDVYLANSDEEPSSRPVSSSSTLPVFPMAELDSGINWKYAYQGSNLLTQALHESECLQPDQDDTSKSFCRDLYISSITYILRGLPSDLTASEALNIQASLPTVMVDTITAQHAHNLELIYSSPQARSTQAQETSGPPSILHRALAYIVLQVFVFVHFCLPYLKVFISQAYAYERRHHISQRVLAASMETFDGLGRRTTNVVNSVYAINDGKLGEAINELTVWWIREVSGGIQQGVRDGVLALREAGEETDRTARSKSAVR